jgi:hypothetical protein
MRPDGVLQIQGGVAWHLLCHNHSRTIVQMSVQFLAELRAGDERR